MKKMMITASAFLFSMALTTGAMAAGEYGSDAKSPGQSEQQMGAGSAQQQDQFGAQQQDQQLQTAQDQQVKSTNKLIGKAVQGQQGKELGNISDIMIDTQSGQVAYALVSSGGVLGMGEDQYIVPWNALQTDPQTDSLSLSISQDQLQNAPKGQTVADREQAREIHQFYGVSPYWEQSGQQQPQQQQQFQMDQQQQEPMLMEQEGEKQKMGE